MHLMDAGEPGWEQSAIGSKDTDAARAGPGKDTNDSPLAVDLTNNVKSMRRKSEADVSTPDRRIVLVAKELPKFVVSVTEGEDMLPGRDRPSEGVKLSERAMERADEKKSECRESVASAATSARPELCTNRKESRWRKSGTSMLASSQLSPNVEAVDSSQDRLLGGSELPGLVKAQVNGRTPGHEVVWAGRMEPVVATSRRGSEDTLPGRVGPVTNIVRSVRALARVSVVKPKRKWSKAGDANPECAKLCNNGDAPQKLKSATNGEESGPMRLKPARGATASIRRRLCRSGGGPVCRKSMARKAKSTWQELRSSRKLPRRNRSETDATSSVHAELLVDSKDPGLTLSKANSKETKPTQFKPEADIVRLTREDERMSGEDSKWEASSSGNTAPGQASEREDGRKSGSTRSGTSSELPSLLTDGTNMMSPTRAKE